MSNVFLTPPPAADVTIVSDEGWSDLAPLIDALERRGLGSEIVTEATAGADPGSGVCYIRRLDPTLTNLEHVARSLSRASGPADVNPARSVRLTEWAPLADHALRLAAVPQPRRVWCIDAHDVERAAAALGLPVVIQGVVARDRVLAETAFDVASAAHALEAGEAPFGALVERPLAEPVALLDVLVVAGRAAGFAFTAGGELSALAADRIERVAVRAVAALGGDVMAVAVAVDRKGGASVREVQAAPAPARFGRQGCEAIADEVAQRAERARAERSTRRTRLRRRCGTPAARMSSPVAEAS